jgi:hypothetical protein
VPPVLVSSGSLVELAETYPLVALLAILGLLYVVEIAFRAIEKTGRTSPFIEFVRIVVGDFLRVAVVWVLLYLFDLLIKYMPVPGFAGPLIHAIHQAGSVALVLILVIWLLIDVVKSLRKK